MTPRYSLKNIGKTAALTGLAGIVALTTGCASIKRCVISQKNPYIIYGEGQWFPHWGVDRGGDPWYINAGKMAIHGGIIYGASELLSDDDDKSTPATDNSNNNNNNSGGGSGGGSSDGGSSDDSGSSGGGSSGGGSGGGDDHGDL